MGLSATIAEIEGARPETELNGDDNEEAWSDGVIEEGATEDLLAKLNDIEAEIEGVLELVDSEEEEEEEEEKETSEVYERAEICEKVVENAKFCIIEEDSEHSVAPSSPRAAVTPEEPAPSPPPVLNTAHRYTDTCLLVSYVGAACELEKLRMQKRKRCRPQKRKKGSVFGEACTEVKTATACAFCRSLREPFHVSFVASKSESLSASVASFSQWLRMQYPAVAACRSPRSATYTLIPTAAKPPLSLS